MSTRHFDHLSYPRAYIRIRPSIILPGQVGSFANRNFSIGEIIVRSEEFEDGNVMSVSEYEMLDSDTKELVKAHSTITVDTVFMPANLNYLRPINYFNHSCAPNTGFDEHDNYVAIADIPNGTEFLLDYSFLNTNPNYRLDCTCGAPNCRKVITGNEWKNPDFVARCKPYFCSTVREMLSAE